MPVSVWGGVEFKAKGVASARRELSEGRGRR